MAESRLLQPQSSSCFLPTGSTKDASGGVCLTASLVREGEREGEVEIGTSQCASSDKIYISSKWRIVCVSESVCVRARASTQHAPSSSYTTHRHRYRHRHRHSTYKILEMSSLRCQNKIKTERQNKTRLFVERGRWGAKSERVCVYVCATVRFPFP